MKPRLSKLQAESIIKLVLHHYLEIFHYLKSSRGGELVWPDHFITIKNNLKLDNYVDLYDDERKIRGSMKLSLFSTEGLEQLRLEQEAKSEDERQADLDNLISEVLRDGEAFIQEMKNVAADYPSLTESEIQKSNSESTPEDVARIQYMLLSTLALLHNVFSIMVFGVRLTTLVNKATSGDDEAFLQAIKIDHTLISQHPHFRERFDRATKNQETNFLNRIHEKQLSPSLRGRIKHGALYTMFYFLDELKVLDEFSNSELHELYLSCNLTDLETPIYESSSFARQLKKFKAIK